MFRILSIDGGGIRGMIPALILAELERRSGKQTHELFDLIAGTSTGGILALGLSRPGGGGRAKYSADNLADLYEKEGSTIFSRSVWHRIRSVEGVAEEKYPSDGVEEVLDERFQSSLISEALVPILVTAYDIELRRPHFFKSHRATEDERRNVFMRDAARATSAAPTYFEPAQIRAREGGDKVALVDGGVFANNPAACALVEAIADLGASPDEIAMLSLGTGEYTTPVKYQDAKDWGLAKWAQPILSVVFDGVSDTVNYQVGSILGSVGGKERYLRIQTQLTKDNDAMDDAGEENIKGLKLVARDLIARHDDDLDDWVGLLTGADDEGG